MCFFYYKTGWCPVKLPLGLTSHYSVTDMPQNNDGCAEVGISLLLDIQIIRTAHINQCDVPISNVKNNKAPSSRTSLKSCFKCAGLTMVINTALTLTLLLNYNFTYKTLLFYVSRTEHINQPLCQSVCLLLIYFAFTYIFLSKPSGAIGFISVDPKGQN